MEGLPLSQPAGAPSQPFPSRAFLSSVSAKQLEERNKQHIQASVSSSIERIQSVENAVLKNDLSQ